MPAKATDCREITESSPSADRALPPWKAFVVQLTRETEAGGGVFAGRVEHLGSGRRARFESGEALIAAIAGLLDEIGDGEG